MYITDSIQINITSSSFQSNALQPHNGGSGGAIALYIGSAITITSCNFTSNVAGGSWTSGGAIAVIDYTGVTLSNLLFSLNNNTGTDMTARSLYISDNSVATLKSATFPTSSLPYVVAPYEVYVDASSNLTSCTLGSDAMTAKVRI